MKKVLMILSLALMQCFMAGYQNKEVIYVS
jgi:hypothetical protein